MKTVLLWKKIWQLAKKYKLRFILSYTVLLVELIFNQMLPLYLGNVVDAAIYKADMLMFLNASLAYAMIFFWATKLRIFTTTIMANT